MSLQECFEKGLLKKTSVDENKVGHSLELAKHFIERSEGNLGIGFFDIAFITAYNSMFHSARALLFSKGFKERSHGCLALFIKTEFFQNKKVMEFVQALDSYRISRHMIQYDGASCDEKDAKQALSDAKAFLSEAKHLLKIK